LRDGKKYTSESRLLTNYLDRGSTLGISAYSICEENERLGFSLRLPVGGERPASTPGEKGLSLWQCCPQDDLRNGFENN
jgi:hypothetical protein